MSTDFFVDIHGNIHGYIHGYTHELPIARTPMAAPGQYFW